MTKMNPIRKSAYINEQYKEYLRFSFHFGDEKIQQLFYEALDKEVLFKGPYVDMVLPFKKGAAIDDLIEEGTVSPLFRELKNIDFKRPLYIHQEKSLRHVNSGRSAVITTGTGSGKTESFLYPILNDILRDIEQGKDHGGIRAVFLYPMNALVNDQIDRVRAILKNHDQITFGCFTGETQETRAAALRKRNGDNVPDNEIISRDDIRKNPPHLLFTNHSMLEYLLIRPEDHTIFTEHSLRNWKYIVLDEAHTYTGVSGIEMAFLLRRVTGLAPRKPRFILTSATLGEKGKSEDEILHFAHNLTSSEFEKDDIIFADRIVPDGKEGMYSLTDQEYIQLQRQLDNIEGLRAIASRYIDAEGLEKKELLYELLSRDRNVLKLCRLLQKKCRLFSELEESFAETLTEDGLIAMIDLVNGAEKNGTGLFDMKYHSFIRPLAGAYVTVGPNPQLRLTKTNEIDGMKAFEMGNCRFCNSPYIIGRMISKDDSPQLYLVQNDEIDIYENYGENSWAKLDYFLLSDEMEDDGNDLPALEPYVLCGKCGSIHAKENLNADGCKCGEEFQSIIYKVRESDSSKTGPQAENNIHVCPHCGHQSQSGIIRNLNLGKDEGTALTSQILLEAMDEDSKASDTETRNPLPPTPSKKLDLKDLFTKKKSEIPQKVKQFLAFSDSRQQASFAALFFSRNYKRIMQKRLIWEVLQKNNFEDVAFSRLISKLTNLIEENDLFPEQASHEKSAWLTALVELLKVDGDYDGEKLGLYYFDLNVDDIKEGLSDAENLTGFKNFIFGQEHDCNFTAEEILALIKGICAVFKNVPAIDYRDSDLMKKEKEEDLQYRRFNNFVQLKSDSKKTNIYSLLPISRTANNKVVRYVMKMCNCDSDTAKSIIENVFNALINYSEDETVQPLFYYDQNNRAYQIKADKYILRSYRKHACYRCKTCGRLTPYNIGNHCPTDKCEGILEQVDPDEVLKTNYFRNQYMHRKIERIVAKEHTAQLDRKTAKQYQNDFKNKKINILSCSTTFEMGIDIGDLETVFMRNIPPSPANYVQRAGRAGRRKDSAAYILTYCSVSSHDYTYFCEPEKMISGIIRPPYFNINNSKVIERHLMSCYLGSFFKNNPGYYKKLSDMFFEENGPTGVHRFNEYISSHPEDLNRYVNEKVIPEPEYARYRNFEHFDAEGGQDVKLSWMMEDLNRIRKEYQEAIESAKHSEEFKEGQYCQAALDNLKATPVINALSRYSVIPKYGFPVDVVELKIYEHGRPVYRDDANRGGLNRDLKIAISEYAPDSEVVMDGTKYTSKYVVTPQNGEFPKKYFYTCPVCQKLNIFLSKANAETCQYCHSDIEERLSDYFIEPVYGFRTGPGKSSKHLKPKRSYAGEVLYLGQGIQDETVLELGNGIEVQTFAEDELLVLNKSTFYMCPVCGYAEISHDKIVPDSKTVNHNRYNEHPCHNKKLERIHLGHRFKTDVTKFIIPALIADGLVGKAKALSFMYAFLEGISNALEIERNDISGILQFNSKTSSFDIIIYDDVPGGAGHVKRLLDRTAIKISLEEALRKVSKECCDEDTSCYNCLRNYYNQSYHKYLKRRFAKEIITELLKQIDNR